MISSEILNFFNFLGFFPLLIKMYSSTLFVERYTYHLSKLPKLHVLTNKLPLCVGSFLPLLPSFPFPPMPGIEAGIRICHPKINKMFWKRDNEESFYRWGRYSRTILFNLNFHYFIRSKASLKTRSIHFKDQAHK